MPLGHLWEKTVSRVSTSDFLDIYDQSSPHKLPENGQRWRPK